jgi:hypothetical protein
MYMALATGVLIVLLAYLLRWIFGSKQRSNDHYMWILLVLLGLALAVPSHAAIHPVDGKTSGAIDTGCVAQARQAALVINALPHPADWQYYVYCNQNVWENALRSADNHGTDWAFTSLRDHKTYINGTMFQRRADLPLGITPEFILAHELGHIALSDDSEDVANTWARQQLKK